MWIIYYFPINIFVLSISETGQGGKTHEIYTVASKSKWVRGSAVMLATKRLVGVTLRAESGCPDNEPRKRGIHPHK